MMDQLSRTGVVDEVKAIRHDDVVSSLQATINFKTGLRDSYQYSATDKIQIDKLVVSFGALAGVNPGDLVQMDLVIQSPLTQRFAPMLEAGTVDDDDDDDGDDDADIDN